MGFLDLFRRSQKFDVAYAAQITAAATPPVYQLITDIKTFWQEFENPYDLYEQMANDPFISGALNAIAAEVTRCFQGLEIKSDTELTSKQQELLKMGQEVYDELQLDLHIPSTAFNIMKDGDVIFIWDNGQLRQLPIKYMSITETKEQIGKMTGIEPDQDVPDLEQQLAIFKPNFYIFCEGMPTEIPYTADQVIHISRNPSGQQVYDRFDRYTFGVWSKSPLRPLKDFFTFKQNMMIIDGLWRQRMVPREHHILQLSSVFDPNRMRGGSYEERVTTAETLARSAIKKYRDDIKTKEADQGYCTSDGVEIKIVESSTRTYADPNPLFEYCDKAVSAALGVTRAALVGDTQGSFAQELVLSSYAAMRAEELAKIVARAFIKVIRTKVQGRTKTIFEDEDLRTLDFKLELILNQDRDLLSRVVSTFAATEKFTYDELRDMAGYPPLTKKQMKRWKELQDQYNEMQPQKEEGREPGAPQTPKDSAQQAKRKTGPGQPSTPQSTRERQIS